MSEVVLTGIGRSETKPTLKDWAKKTFTFGGAEEAWRKTHTKEIEEMTKINASLSEDDRVKAMEKLDKSIKNSTKLRVVGNYGALAVVSSAIAFGGVKLIQHFLIPIDR